MKSRGLAEYRGDVDPELVPGVILGGQYISLCLEFWCLCITDILSPVIRG